MTYDVDEQQQNSVRWAGSPDLGSFDPAYKVVGIGDFSHDGTSDVLWRNPTTGAADDWILNNGQWSRSVSLGSFDANYIVAGTGDFDRSYTADIPWRNPSTGQANEWLLATA